MTRTKVLAVAAGLLAAALSASQAQDVTATEARAIAKEAYIYGFPMVDSYRIQYAYFVDSKNPEFKGPWNELACWSADSRRGRQESACRRVRPA
jgi:hypothetical protein